MGKRLAQAEIRGGLRRDDAPTSVFLSVFMRALAKHFLHYSRAKDTLSNKRVLSMCCDVLHHIVLQLIVSYHKVM